MITQTEFGQMPDGTSVTEYTLTNKHGSSVRILDYGCIVRSISVFGCDVCLGYDTLKEYLEDDAHMGAVVGRCANRIGNGSFVLNGKTFLLAQNDGDNHLHGGIRGFDRYLWHADTCGEKLVLRRTSPNGEEGYPGTLQVSVAYELTEDNTLTICYEAVCDADTLFNPTSHIYFNLNGHGSGTVLGHTLRLNSDRITENDSHTLPTGHLIAVDGTPFDFRIGKRLGSCLPDGGYDHNYDLTTIDGKTAAVLTGEKSGICMEVYTDCSGIQLYSGNFLTPRRGKDGAVYQERGAICLETQNWPDAIHHEDFPSPVLQKEEQFRSVTQYRFYCREV